MLVLENTESMRDLKKVAASMAIENIYPTKEFAMELVKVARGEKSSEELRQEVTRRYVR